jgi:hypothetical protein
MHADNARWFFGASDDDAIYHDGSDLVLEPAKQVRIPGPVLTEGSSVAVYRHAFDAYYGTSSLTGTIKIRLPFDFDNVFFTVKIRGFNYTGTGDRRQGAWEAAFGAYPYSSLNWYAQGGYILGRAPFTAARFAHDGVSCCLLLGDTSTVWSFPFFDVELMVREHDVVDLNGSWAIDYTTNESAWSLSSVEGCPLEHTSELDIQDPTADNQVLQATGSRQASWTTDIEGLTSLSVNDNITIGGSDVCKVLGADKTFYVRTNGNDSNDGTSVANAFATPARAIDELYRWVADGYDITIDFGEGHYSVPEALVPSYAYGANVTFTGSSYPYTNCGITSVGTIHSSSYPGLEFQDIDVTLPSEHPAVANDFLIVKTASGGTNPEYVLGCHQIQSVSGQTVTIRVYRRLNTSPVPNTSVTIDTCSLIKTVLTWSSGNGIKLRGAYHAGVWDKMVLKGDLASTGVWVLNGATIEVGSDFGTSHWGTNIYAQNNGLFFGDSSSHSLSTSDIVRTQNGAVVNLRYNANLTGAADFGIIAFLGGTVAFAYSYLVGCSNDNAVYVIQNAYVDLKNAVLRPGASTYGVHASKGGGVDLTGVDSTYTTLADISGTGYSN